MSEANDKKTKINDPWRVYPTLPYAFINDDFLHDKKAVLKVNLKGDRGGVSIKQSASRLKDGYSLSDQAKFWVSMTEGKTLFARIKSAEHIHLHFQNFITEAWTAKLNGYTALKFNRQLHEQGWHFGVTAKNEKLDSDLRLRVDTGEQWNVNVSNRTLYTKDRLTFGWWISASLFSFIVHKNNLLLGYQIDDRTSIAFRAQTDKKRTSPLHLKQQRHLFDHFIVDVVSKYDQNTTLGLQTSFQSRQKIFKQAQIVVSNKVNQHLTAKAKVSTLVNLDLLMKFPLPFSKQNSLLSLGMHGSNLHRESRSFKFGTQLQFNF